jgi:hypothetical protein
MALAIPLLSCRIIDKTQIGFVDQRCSLESLARGFLHHLLGSQFSQLVIDQPQELLGCGGIASFNLRENLSDIGHKGQNTAENDGMPPVDLASNLNASTERAGGNHNCFVY